MFVSRQIIDISNHTAEDKAGDSQCLAGNFETIKIPQVTYGSVKHASAHGLAQCHSFTLITICNKRRFGKLPMTDRVYGSAPECQARPYMKIQVRRLIDIRVVSGKKKRSGDCECVVGVGEAVPDQPC